MASNLYKVGDWVFCEVSPHQPYVIRKIEELTKTPCGNVEAKVICAFRHQDIPPAIMANVEKYQAKNSEKPATASASASATEVSAADQTAATTTTAATATTTTTTSANGTVNTPAAADKTGNSNSSGGGGSANGAPATTTTPSACDYEESEVSDLSDQQRYNLKHRELYFSKYTDTIAATAIRCKCSVLLFNEEIERYSDYLNRDDAFYYHLTYDPYQKSIVADKGEIRVGFRYQTEIPTLKLLSGNGSLEANDKAVSEQVAQQERTAHNDRVLRSQLSKMAAASGAQKENSSKLAEQSVPEISIYAQTEELIQWYPVVPEDAAAVADDAATAAAAADRATTASINRLTDKQIDQFLVLAKSVGTYARALDCNNAYKQPSLPLSAAAASRDITLFYAMNTLHENNYDIGRAALSMITGAGPVICRDELEDWSASEANLFEDALEKYGKDFIEIRKEVLPWKTTKSIIEYYYTWKTTDRYVQQKRLKLSEQESKLKQVYIPNHSKQNQSSLIKSAHVQLFNQYDVHLKSSCESCGAPNTSTNQWYTYNASTLVQLIMSGNTNQSALASAALQLQQQSGGGASTSTATNPATGNPVTLQARVCPDCWHYWKKFAAFKFPNARQERLNQLKNQTHKCSVLGCGREFKMKQLLIKHCGIAHGYFAKTANPPPGQNSIRPAAIRNRTAFYLLTTPMSQAARFLCTSTIRLKKLARKPFKLVELAELNKEWNKQNNRNISQILAEAKKRRARVTKLSVQLIAQIAKSRAKLLRRAKAADAKRAGSSATAAAAASVGGVNGHAATNGHHQQSADAEDDAENDVDEDDDDDELLIIDSETTDVKPEFMRYFEQKCTTPCFAPERLAFPKPSADQINKSHLNLMSQNRKRSHEQSMAAAAEATATNGAGSQANGAASTGGDGASNSAGSDVSPQSKRSLLSNSSSSNGVAATNSGAQSHSAVAKSVAGAAAATAKQSAVSQQSNKAGAVATTAVHHRFPQKSIMKPTQFINLVNVREDIYYVAVSAIKNLRRDLQVALLRKLARKPFKQPEQEFKALYASFDKLRDQSLAKLAEKDSSGGATADDDAKTAPLPSPLAPANKDESKSTTTKELASSKDSDDTAAANGHANAGTGSDKSSALAESAATNGNGTSKHVANGSSKSTEAAAAAATSEDKMETEATELSNGSEAADEDKAPVSSNSNSNSSDALLPDETDEKLANIVKLKAAAASVTDAADALAEQASNGDQPMSGEAASDNNNKSAGEDVATATSIPVTATNVVVLD